MVTLQYSKNTLAAPPSVILLPLVGTFASWLLSIRFSQSPPVSVAALPALVGNLAVLAVAANFPEERLPVLGWCWLGAAAVGALNGLVRVGEGDFVSTVGNRNFLAAYLAASVCIAAGLWNWRSAVAALLLLAGMVFCQSRGAWLALAGAATLMFLLEVRLRMIWKVLVIAVIVTGTISFAGPYIIQQWRADVRPVIWRGAWLMVRARPLVGHGLKTFEIEYAKFRLPEYFLRPKATNLTDHAHNELLELAVEQGVLGLSATLWLLGVAVGQGVRTWRNSNKPLRRLRLGLLAATTVLILHGMVDVDLRYPPNQTLLWMLLGLLVSGNGRPPTTLRLNSKASRGVLAAACCFAAAIVAVESVVLPVWVDILERKARVAEARNDLLVAAETANRALQNQPFRLGTRYFLAGVLARIPSEEARARAIEQCLRIEELAPDYGDITFNLGQLYVAAHQPANALPYLRRAVEINPYNAQKRVVLALALEDLRQSDAAREQLETALTLNPGDKRARDLLMKFQRDGAP